MPSSENDLTAVDDLESRIPGAFPGADSPLVSTHQALSQALYARRTEYTRPRNIRIKVGTWNIAAFKDAEKDIAGWFIGGDGIEKSIGGLGINDEPTESRGARSDKKSSTFPDQEAETIPGNDEIGLYALGLQEVVDITSATEALRPYTDPSTANRIKASLQERLPAGYQLVAEQQLIGLLLLIYAAPSVVPHVQSVSTTSVGTGLMGYMGNKGAVTARLLLGETTRLVFVNCHLAAGADKASVERRNWDAAQIATRTKFTPIPDALGTPQSPHEGIGEEDFAFWFGDLNYRLEGMPGDDVRRLLTVHTRGLDPEPLMSGDLSATAVGSDDISTVNTTSQSSLKTVESEEEASSLPARMDPASVLTTISSLLPHDELHQQQKSGKAFQDGWKEGPIEFLPTYKYDVGKVGVFDSSDKKRCPSWCDRILYRTRAAKLAHDAKVHEREEAKKKDEEMKARGIAEAENDEDVLFDYNPDTDGADDDYDEFDDPEPETVVTKQGFDDEILLEYYTAHQRVLSSDHKPLDAVFALKYDAVIPDLKAHVHQEVVKELDRTENEGRPSITLVVDRSPEKASTGAVSEDTIGFYGVDFEEVRYATPKRRSITIANTGRVPATFGFTNRSMGSEQSKGPLPSWLSARFDREPSSAASDQMSNQYTIEPAEVVNIELTAKIESNELVRELNEGTAHIDDILVLRVQNGRDHFLPIRGHWLQSTFARSIDKLIRIPEGGIRKLQHQKPESDVGVKWSAPRELFRLTEALETLTERTVADWDMTGHEEVKAPWQHNAAWPFTRNLPFTAGKLTETLYTNVYEALDCDKTFDSAFAPDIIPMQRLEVLADVLLRFLQSLEDGVVTKDMWEQLEKGMAAQERSKQQRPPEEERLWVLEILSSVPNHNVSFILLTSMLSRMANEIANVSKTEQTPRSSVELPQSPVSVRRRTLSKIPEVAIRQLISRNYAAVFAGAIIRTPDGAMKDKEQRLREERMSRMLEIFLDEGK
ncbi:DNase I-like protein [Delitschia confertaspora ATCC 74209]|uniref:DNase I-like protein n=1 Tax=Delitschia confertaspora ATCC 74209 TaxID=1513339 RepID=A0A9P4MTQ7_9PLEO|nr:DNase I-like protein [Delitschia confertaspora ATCC 74209]